MPGDERECAEIKLARLHIRRQVQQRAAQGIFGNEVGMHVQDVGGVVRRYLSRQQFPIVALTGELAFERDIGVRFFVQVSQHTIFFMARLVAPPGTRQTKTAYGFSFFPSFYTFDE